MKKSTLSLTLRDVPEALHERLKESAAKNRRSLNEEVLARLEAGLTAPLIGPAALAGTLKAHTASLPRVHHAKAGRYRRAGRK